MPPFPILVPVCRIFVTFDNVHMCYHTPIEQLWNQQTTSVEALTIGGGAGGGATALTPPRAKAQQTGRAHPRPQRRHSALALSG